MVDCDVCGAKVNEVRRGRCWGCYQRWVDARPVGLGARCVLCGERRRRVLHLVELLGTWQPTCFNCHGQVMALDPVPADLAELRDVLERERRKLERRVDKPDTRVFRYERRVGERRVLPGSPGCRADGADGERFEWPSIDDDMIIEVVVEAGDAAGGDFEEMTRIHAIPL